MIPTAYVVPATDRFEGADGKWTTFYLNIGSRNDSEKTGGQNFRALVSTSSGVTILPMRTDWCTTDLCTENRGLEIFQDKRPTGFESSKVAVYNGHGQYTIPRPYGLLGSQFNEGDEMNAAYGFSTVGFGKAGKDSVITANRLVAASPFRDYFMGQFGLGIQDNLGARAFLPVFEEQNNIPSLTYAYTAGAYYRRDGRGVRGSLILGGYDKSRFRGDVEYPSIRLPEGNNTLLVNVKSILYSPDPARTQSDVSFTAGANTSTFYASIDSTFPYLFLPSEICDRFRDRFRLTYDELRNLYFVNETSHEFNKGTNASVKFFVGENSDTATMTSTIELPYAAFDHNIDAPLLPNGTRYFPIKKSKNGMYTLGRAFLQEAYITVDYTNRNFTVAPASWSDPMPPSAVVPIVSKKWMSSTASTTPNPPPPSGGLSGGAIAGIVVGILVSLGFLGLGAFFYWKKRRAMLYKNDSESDAIQTSDLVKYGRVLEPGHELPGSPGYYARETKDGMPFPRLPELESPPQEMYSPPLESATPGTGDGIDYFAAGNKVRRRGATRESTGNNTPGTPVVELPGDDGKFTVDGQHFDPVQSPVISPIMSPVPSSPPSHHRGPSDTSLQTNIDEVMAQNASPRNRSRSPSTAGAPLETHADDRRLSEVSPIISPVVPARPPHTRGLSEITVRSDSTGISNPSPEEIEVWNKHKDDPMRPLSE